MYLINNVQYVNETFNFFNIKLFLKTKNNFCSYYLNLWMKSFIDKEMYMYFVEKKYKTIFKKN